MMKKMYSLLCLLALAWGSMQAQRPLPNTAIQHGEKLVYELYFNWNFVWMKAGSAIFLTNKTHYEGKDCFRSFLITRTSSSLDNYFMMRDTLSGVFTTDNVPLYYRKGANEGKKYRCDEVWYRYPGGGVTTVAQRYVNPYGKVTTQQRQSPYDVYDMMSLMQRARSMRPTDFKKGEKKKFYMADGSDIEEVHVVYRGTETVAMRSGKTKYRCLVFSFVETEEGKDKEIIRFFITDDSNHMPIRLDMYLKFGTAKAYLLSASGLKHPQKAKI